MTIGEERVQNEEQQPLPEPQPEPPIERKVEQLEQRVREIESQCSNARDRVQGLVARNLALTEVIRFFEDHAPADAYEATRKMLAMYEKDDAWWTAAVRNKDIWEWAAELAPHHRKKWKKAYDTKFGSNIE